MWNYIRQSIARKRARRITRKYDTVIDHFEIEGIGRIDFANWTNPLVEKKVISRSQVDFFAKFLKPGDLAVDIGGNVGHMTIAMSLAAGREGRVVSFDPNPFVYDILVKNAGLNPGLTRIDTFPYAIADHEGEFYYNSSEASFNNGGISEDTNSRHGRFALDHKIKGIKLESLLEEKYPEELGKLRLIKIDTEGYDKEIIRSIRPILQKYRPTVITEVFKNNDASARAEQFELLSSCGYTMYYFSDFVADAEVIRIENKDQMMQWKHFDMYAICN